MHLGPPEDLTLMGLLVTPKATYMQGLLLLLMGLII